MCALSHAGPDLPFLAELPGERKKKRPIFLWLFMPELLPEITGFSSNFAVYIHRCFFLHVVCPKYIII